MRRKIIAVALALALFSGELSWGTSGEMLDADAIMTKMKEALEPGIASTRTLKFTIKDNKGEVTNRWIAREARMKLPDGKRTVMVLVQPEEVKGMARLLWEHQGGDCSQWLYLPALKRISQTAAVNAYESYQGTDFTYSDIGFLTVLGSHEVMGEINHKGVEAYKILTIPSQRDYFLKIITIVAKDSFLPLERNMYDINDVLWKRQFFEEITIINKIPTPLDVRMVDVQTGTSTAYKVDDVCYGAVIPTEIFEPKNLSGALQFDFCPIPSAE